MCRSVNKQKGQVKTAVEQENSILSLKTVIIWSFIGVFFVWALTFILFFLSSMESRGQFGDMFGAVNALFSGLAFAAYYHLDSSKERTSASERRVADDKGGIEKSAKAI